MTTKDRIKTILEQLQLFFLTHQATGWAGRCSAALRSVAQEDADLKEILRDFTGTGMGSLTDLYICPENGHTLQTTEAETNKQLTTLASQLLAIQQALGRK